MKALLKNYRQSPRKVRLIANAIKGKSVENARALLNLLAKRGSEPLLKLLNSAVANAKQTGADFKDLYVANMTVDKGVVLKRFRPRAFGRAFPIRKKTSIVKVTLAKKK